MRKFLIIILALVMVVLSACNNKPQFFYPLYYFEYIEDKEEETPPVGKEPSKEMLSKIETIYVSLCEYYNISKPMPNVVLLSEADIEKTSEKYTKAFYVSQSRTLYLSQSTSDANIAHELMHYLSDSSDDGIFGGEYVLDEEIIVGLYLNEGLTNYFSTQLYPHDVSTSVYEYETHVAKLLAIIFGEETLRNAYFNSNMSYIKEEFNKSLSKYYGSSFIIPYTDINLTCFDAFACCVSAYTDTLLLFLNGSPEYRDVFIMQAQTIEEMLIFLATEKGCKKEVINTIREFQPSSQWLNFQFQYLY